MILLFPEHPEISQTYNMRSTVLRTIRTCALPPLNLLLNSVEEISQLTS